MRLIALELQGFKSFPDKTVLRFAPGVTTVVGPNGSGKSNISDAVRWVLGEISSKNMRGSRMEDVIFGGTDNRKPMQYAEVSLILDNTEAEGFSRLQSDYDEVTVTRRYNRNGSSDYMINRKSVRLKDIIALFMNTGIGRDGYSIVSQGKAAEIISQKSDERRNVFEEAAGISKYRYQKNDAEKKLAETVLNCERLADILLEKKTALDKLEKDAERARRYIEIFEQKKAADVAISLYEINNYSVKIQTNKVDQERLGRAISIAEAEIRDFEKQAESLEIENYRAKEKASSLTSQIEDILNAKAQQGSNASVYENDIKYSKERIIESENVIEGLKKDLEIQEKDYTLSENAYNEAVKKEQEADKKRLEYEEILSKLKDSIDALDLIIESKIEKSENIKKSQEDLKIRLASLEGNDLSSDTHKSNLEAEIKEANLTIKSCTEGMEISKAKMDNYSNKKDNFNSQIEDNDKKIRSLKNEIDKLKAQIFEYNSDIREITTKIDNQRRMNELFEGYPQSVSKLMGAAKVGAIKGIIGPLSHIFTVDGQYSLAIETALGQNIQNIVCETDNAAKDAVAWLKQNNAGRSTFYPLNTMQVTPLNIDENLLKNRKGYIGIASNLVDYEPKFDKVIKNLLGRTLVFDNLDNANDTSKAFGYRVRIVTKDGQLVNAGGSITGGSSRRESGVLNKSASIDKLNADKLKIEADRKVLEEKLNAKNTEVEKIENTNNSLFRNLKLIEQLYQADFTQYTQFETQLSASKESLKKFEEQIKDAEGNKAKIEAEKKEIASRQIELDDLLTSTENVRKEKVSERDNEKTKYEQETQVFNSIMIELNGANKDVESTLREKELRLSICGNTKNKIETEESNIEKNKAKIVDFEEKKIKASELAQKLDEEVEKMTKERDAANDLSNELDKKLAKVNQDIKDKSGANTSLNVEKTEVDGKLEQNQKEFDNWVEHLQEEYKLYVGEAEKLGYEPVTKENYSEVNKKLTEFKNKLRAVGSVDPNSIEEFIVAKKTYDDMSVQFEDLTKSRAEFEHTVEVLEKEMRTRFVEVMEEINTAFQKVFQELFGGGHAELILTDPEDVLHCGIEINVAPPGKIIKNLSLLSGGEQAFISIALFFAILHVNPSPFCIFDEIEAALDEVNVAMFANYIKKYSDKTQFIVITHRRGTMEVADTLYGVTMAERGISKVLSLNVNEVETKLGVKL